MLYLASVAQSDLDDGVFVKSVAGASGSLSEIGIAFSNVLKLNKEWGYELPDCFEIVSKKVRSRWLSDLMKRMGQAIKIGTRLVSVVRGEFSKQREISLIEFERRMDRLKTIGDAFAAIISSLSFLQIALMLTSVLLGGDPHRIVVTVMYGIIVTYVVIIFYAAMIAGEDRYVSEPSRGFSSVKLLERYSPFLLITTVSITATIQLTFNGMDAITALSIPGAVLMLPTLLTRKVFSSVSKVDRYLPFLMKDLSETMAVTKVASRAVEVIRVNDYGPLSPLLRRLLLRLKVGIDFEVAWSFFIDESKSQLAKEVGEVFSESVRRGVQVRELGRLLHDYLVDRLNMRRKRQQVAGYVKGLIFPITLAISATMGLMGALFSVFDLITQVTQAGGQTAFAFGGFGELRPYTMLFMTVTSAIGGTFIHVVERKSSINLLFHSGALMLLTGVVAFSVSNLIEPFLSSAAGRLLTISRVGG